MTLKNLFKHTILYIVMLVLLINVVSADCEIRYLTNDAAVLGENDGVFLFQIYEELFDQDWYNDSIIHASCSLNIFNNKTLQIIDTIPYNDIEHGIRYSTVLGAFTFEVDFNKPFWTPNTNYTWQVYCYCLNDSTMPSVHRCYYEQNKIQTPQLDCSLYGNFITGDDERSVGDTGSGSIAVTLFILFITGLLIFGSSRDYSHNIFANLIIKRSMIVIAFYLMTLNSAIIAVIANSAGLEVTSELFMFMWLFGYGGYLAIVFLVLKTLYDVLKDWDIYKTKKRMGGDDDD